jgi:hypothetical protein
MLRMYNRRRKITTCIIFPDIPIYLWWKRQNKIKQQCNQQIFPFSHFDLLMTALLTALIFTTPWIFLLPPLPVNDMFCASYLHCFVLWLSTSYENLWVQSWKVSSRKILNLILIIFLKNFYLYLFFVTNRF